MNPQDQRIAIAKAIGLDTPDNIKNVLRARQEYEALCYYNDRDPGRPPIPDYLNDLNAMHTAEETLNFNQHEIFRYTLASIVAPTKHHWKREHFYALRGYVTATAAQRAEAFLKTLGLWVP